MYFVGNVLSPTDTQPEQHDPTFSFTREEAQFDLKDVPIHMEHDDGMKVGSVMSSWNNKDGSKWIVGKIDDPGMMGSFARHALRDPPLERDTTRVLASRTPTRSTQTVRRRRNPWRLACAWIRGDKTAGSCSWTKVISKQESTPIRHL